jgi:hypothetical protein
VWHDFVPLNAGSHLPVGPEDHVLDLFVKDRRLVAVGFSDDDILLEGINDTKRRTGKARSWLQIVQIEKSGAALRNAE